MESIPPWNDPSIPDDDILYRRVINMPSYFDQSDLFDGEPKLGRAALTFDEDGMSVYRHSLMMQHQVTVEQIRRDPTKYLLYQFQVAAVRAASAGVVDEMDLEDAIAGKAHSLVRWSGPFKPPKQERSTLQRAISAAATLVHFGDL